MRILYVVHGFVPEAVGGVELHGAHLASAMAKDHAVGVLAWRADPARPDYDLEERTQGPLTVWRLNHTYSDLGSFRGTYLDDRIDAIFDDLVARWRPDLVHVLHLIGLSVGILERARRRGLPLVLDLHDYWFGCPRGQRIRDPLLVCHDIDRRLCVACLKPQNYEIRAPRRSWTRWLSALRAPSFRRGLRVLARYDEDMHRVLSLPDALVTPSDFHGDMYRRYGVAPAKLHTIPVGIAWPHPPPRTDTAASSVHGGARIGYLGTLIPSKGAHVLIDAYGVLARPDVTLDIHGVWMPFHGDTGYLDRLKAAAAAVPGTIRFHGRYEQQDVPRILAALDILVVPSVWYESYSIVIREGFRAGVAVVASDHGAMAEAIEHEVTGLRFAPGDAADLARQLRRLLDDPGLRRRLATHPKRVADVEENAARHAELYAALLRDRRARPG
jgi:glycosyltransferase involved in cell wall biosynthesis